jgi:hypothetical protein
VPRFFATFTPDGKHVLTLADTGARLWWVDPPAAKARKPRDLTPEERERFEFGPAGG